MSYEDRNGNEEHATDGDRAKQVSIVKRSLVVFTAEVEAVIAQQANAYDRQ